MKLLFDRRYPVTSLSNRDNGIRAYMFNRFWRRLTKQVLLFTICGGIIERLESRSSQL